jgi:hypothetical protein
MKMSSNNNTNNTKGSMVNRKQHNHNKLDMSQSTYGIKSMSQMRRGGGESEMFYSTVYIHVYIYIFYCIYMCI